MVLRGVREKEKGASRKESEKGGLRCSGAADMHSESEKDNVLCVHFTSNSMELR